MIVDDDVIQRQADRQANKGIVNNDSVFTLCVVCLSAW